MAIGVDVEAISERLISAWNAQDVDRVLACYTDDVVYLDPNTRGEVRGADAFRRYLTKLFAAWEMEWTVKVSHRLAGPEGTASLWHATLRPTDGDRAVEVDGMDLVLLEGDLVKRNEVYYDRAVLAPLLEDAPAKAAA